MSINNQSEKKNFAISERINKIVSNFTPDHFSFFHANLIISFINTVIIKNNILLISCLVFLRVIGRVIIILNFAITLKAVVSAIRPDLLLKLFNRILHHYGSGMTVEYAHLAYIVVALIVIVNIVDWVAFLLTERLTTTLNKRINANSSKFGEDAAMGEDLFLIERVTIITQSVLKCLDALIYISIMMFLIFFFSPILAVFLAPLLLLQIAFQVLSRRSNLKATEENRQIRDGYVFDSQTEGVKNKRLFSEDITERKRYVDSLENRRYSRNLKLHFDNFLGALVLVAVIFYLFSSEMEMDATRASLLILFIVALRQTVGLGKELSREFTALLDLRRDTDKLQYIIDANNLTKKE